MSDQANPIRKKVATLAIPMLAIVCGYLVYTNIFARNSHSTSKSPKPAAVAPPATVAKQGNSPAQKTARQKTSSWPTYTLDEIIGHSPFDPLLNSRSSNAVHTSTPQNFSIQSLPQSITTSSASNSSPSLSTFSSQSNQRAPSAQIGQSKKGNLGKAAPAQLGGGLQAVFKSENGISALVDSKVVRPGDSINGVKIIAITPSAIFLEDHRTIQSQPGKK